MRLQKDEVTQKRQEHAATQQSQDNSSGAIQAAVGSWATQQRALDPEFDRKADMVMERANILGAKEPSMSPERAVEIAKQSLDDVNQRLATFAPKKQPKAPLPSSVGQARNAAPEPETLAEVIQLAARNG